MPQVLQNADQIFNHELRAPVPRSVFNLSHVHSFDADFGELIPFYYQYTTPNDSYTLSAIVKATALPLETPLYTALTIRTSFYYVPFYLLWHTFDRFLEGGRDGRFTVLPPILGDADSGIKFSRNSLADYFGLPVEVQIPADDCPDAFPFMAYQRIWRDYYFSQDIQTDSNVNVLFPENDFDFQLKDGFQTYLGGTGTDVPYDSTDPSTNKIELNKIRYRNWRSDYFTSAMPYPQRGDMVALPLSGTADVQTVDGYKLYMGQAQPTEPNFPLSGVGVASGAYAKSLPTDVDESGSTSGYSLIPEASSTEPGIAFSVGVRASANPLIFHSNLSNNGVTTPTHRFSTFQVPFSSAGTFTVDDLRLATQLQLWLERNMRTKAQYNEFLRIHFNDAPLDLRLTRPYYIGGSSQQILVSEILQTSETTEDSPLGSMAGTGSSFSSNFIGRFDSHEFGIIIGLMSIMPDTMYMQGLDREWNKRTRYDYYFPEFAQLSPQAIMSKELYMSDDAKSNNTVFGYQGRFDEMRHRRNYVSGALRNPSEMDFYTWTMAREFTSVPTLTSSFINSEGTVRHDAFTTGDLHKPFICQTGMEVRAVRPLPVINQPMGLL